MKDKIRVIVAEDNKILAQQICQTIDNSDFAQVIAIAHNGREAVEHLREMHTDVLILDLVMPVIDGIGVLEIIQSEKIAISRIMVLSAIGHEDIIRRVMSLNVHYYMIKPFDLKIVLSRIKSMSTQEEDIFISAPVKNYNDRHKKSLDENITSIFLLIGIPAHIKGYQFLRIAVKKVMETPTLINAITKELYPCVAEEFETTPSKVERAIRHAIEVAWSRGKIENINEIFGYNIYTKNDKPSNGEFIALIADKLTIEGA
ncbi:MAG: sporulation transcription factor Spo0A [Clostridia bacterium]|nr:sporulation transcription factor Spo0A [Clostridia bacterium]